MTTTHAWCLDDLPHIDHAERLELLESCLTGAEARKKELFDLRRVEVAIVEEVLQDDQVALGE